MDLLTVLILLLHQSFLLTSVFQQNQAIHFPTSRYSLLFSAKEGKEDVKRRRQYARRNEQISLKPPPKDWPAPTLGTADFTVYNDSPDATSVSPLQAYQAKLEQELIKQQEKEARQKKLASPKSSEISSMWTSSEEDFKKLLNPDELVKHNRQLKPLVANDKKRRMTKKNVKSTDTHGKKEVKSAPITSLTALKAKANSKKVRRKMLKSDPSKVKTAPTRRGRRKKEKKDLLDDPTPIKEVKKRKAKTKSDAAEAPKVKRRKKKVKKFAFATSHLKESENESTIKSQKNKHSKHTSSEEIVPKTINKNTTITSKATKVIPKATEISTIAALQGTKKSDKNLTDNTTKHLPILTTTINPTTVETTKSYSTIFTTETLVTKMSTTTYYTIIPTTEEPVTKYDATTLIAENEEKREIREKRKQMKLDMEKVLIKEQLDGSFSDKESDWTTSEKKIPISNVTPRKALLGILKHTVVSFIDNILKERPKLSEQEKHIHEQKFTKWNATDGDFYKKI